MDHHPRLAPNLDMTIRRGGHLLDGGSIENRLNPQSHSDGPGWTWWELHFGRPSTENFALCKAVLASKYFSIEFYLGQFDVVSVQCRTELQF